MGLLTGALCACGAKAWPRTGGAAGGGALGVGLGWMRQAAVATPGPRSWRAPLPAPSPPSGPFFCSPAFLFPRVGPRPRAMRRRGGQSLTKRGGRRLPPRSAAGWWWWQAAWLAALSPAGESGWPGAPAGGVARGVGAGRGGGRHWRYPAPLPSSPAGRRVWCGAGDGGGGSAGREGMKMGRGGGSSRWEPPAVGGGSGGHWRGRAGGAGGWGGAPPRLPIAAAPRPAAASRPCHVRHPVGSGHATPPLSRRPHLSGVAEACSACRPVPATLLPLSPQPHPTLLDCFTPCFGPPLPAPFLPPLHPCPPLVPLRPLARPQ